MKTKTVTPPLSLPPFSFAGGLYGWKWGVLSAASLAQTVSPALSEDQPERGAADNHRHCGSVPRRKAAYSSGIPHGEFHATASCFYPRCISAPFVCHAPALKIWCADRWVAAGDFVWPLIRCEFLMILVKASFEFVFLILTLSFLSVVSNCCFSSSLNQSSCLCVYCL